MKICIKQRINYGFNEPMPLVFLPENILRVFRENYELEDIEFYRDDSSGNGSYKQVPQVFWSYLFKSLSDIWVPVWSNNLIERGLEIMRNNEIESLSPEDYPKSSLQIYDALKFVDIKDKNVAVLGSISPWIEVICLFLGAKNVYTIDYNRIIIEHQDDESKRIKFINMKDLNNYDKFDVIITFSSIEHDGLGRYGDPINPYGEIDALNEAYDMLVDDGYLICGIPVGSKNCLICNWHRIFSKEHLNKMFSKFEKIGEIPFPYGSNEIFYGDDYEWQNQPVFVLKK